MKISEMTNDQATEAMIRLSGPISNVCDDKELLALIDKIQGMEGKTSVLEAFGKILPQLVALALQKHKEDLYEIVGALLVIPTAKVGEMNFAETVKAVKDSYDSILAGFFTDSAAARKLRGGDAA